MVSRCARRRRWEVGVRARVLGSNPHPHANPHQDGEHLGRKLLTHMRSSTDAPPYLLVLEAIASCSFLVKLAVAEVREGAPKAAPEDLTTIEEGLRRLKVHGWRNEEEEAGRAPFVRRNLLLLHFVLYCEEIELEP